MYSVRLDTNINVYRKEIRHRCYLFQFSIFKYLKIRVRIEIIVGINMQVDCYQISQRIITL